MEVWRSRMNLNLKRNVDPCVSRNILFFHLLTFVIIVRLCTIVISVTMYNVSGIMLGQFKRKVQWQVLCYTVLTRPQCTIWLCVRSCFGLRSKCPLKYCAAIKHRPVSSVLCQGRVWRCIWPVRHAQLERSRGLRAQVTALGKMSRLQERDGERDGDGGRISWQTGRFLSPFSCCQHSNFLTFFSFSVSFKKLCVLTYTNTPTQTKDFETVNPAVE